MQRWAREGKIRVVKTIGGIRRTLELEIRRLLGEEVLIIEEIKDRSSGLKEDRKGIKRIFELAEKGLN